MQQLRALTVLAEDPGLLSSILSGSKLPVTPVAEDPMPSAGLHRHLHTHGAHTYTQVTHTHI